jgi:hypothetical protein
MNHIRQSNSLPIHSTTAVPPGESLPSLTLFSLAPFPASGYIQRPADQLSLVLAAAGVIDSAADCKEDARLPSTLLRVKPS